MKKIFLLLFLSVTCLLRAQENDVRLKQADNLEKQFKEVEALAIYSEIASADSQNSKVAVKCAELNCSIGARQKDPNAMRNYFDQAKIYADKALAADSNNADANYAQALINERLAGVEKENKKRMEQINNVYIYAEKALSIDSNHAKSNFIRGKWHLDMLDQNWLKKAAIKTFYHKLPKPDIDTAIAYLEKCRRLEPYFVKNYLVLAKAYRFKNRPAPAIEVLQKMVRLPTRTADDAELKLEGKALLESMQ